MQTPPLFLFELIFKIAFCFFLAVTLTLEWLFLIVHRIFIFLTLFIKKMYKFKPYPNKWKTFVHIVYFNLVIVFINLIFIYIGKFFCCVVLTYVYLRIMWVLLINLLHYIVLFFHNRPCSTPWIVGLKWLCHFEKFISPVFSEVLKQHLDKHCI